MPPLRSANSFRGRLPRSFRHTGRLCGARESDLLTESGVPGIAKHWADRSWHCTLGSVVQIMLPLEVANNATWSYNVTV